MTIYVCLDDNDGMLFNKRRQSRDVRILEDMQTQLPGVLTIDPFSEKLIGAAGIPYVLAGETLPEDAHFFLENRPASEVAAQADQVVLYRWNRVYPADVHWDVDLSAEGFCLQGTSEFPGKSHETITKEVYTR